MSSNCLNCAERHSNCEKYTKLKNERELISKKHREFLDNWGYDGCLSPKRRKNYYSI